MTPAGRHPEYDLDQLVRRTKSWMRSLGVSWIQLSDVAAEIHAYVTVQMWGEKFKIGINQDGEATQHTNEVFQKVKLEMIREGFPIGRHHFAGHFIGHPGEQAINVYYNVQTAMSLLQTARDQLEAIKDSGQYATAVEFLKGRVVPSRLLSLLRATPGVIPEQYDGAVPSQAVAELLQQVTTWENELPKRMRYKKNEE